VDLHLLLVVEVELLHGDQRTQQQYSDLLNTVLMVKGQVDQKGQNTAQKGHKRKNS